MKPGREMDRLIAEKIMNLPHIRTADYLIYDTDIFKPVPFYSTRIEDAWELVEKFVISVAVPGSPDSSGCSFSHYTAIAWAPTDKASHYHIYEWGDTAPHAICLAALKAHGVTL